MDGEGGDRPVARQRVRFAFHDVALDGTLSVPHRPWALGVFLSESPSWRGARDSFGALPGMLEASGMATLFTDLGCAGDGTAEGVRRVVDQTITVLDRTRVRSDIAVLPVAALGSGAGAAAALWLAALLPREVGAAVSIHGRLDLAERALGLVMAPTVLIADPRDEAVMETATAAARQLRPKSQPILVLDPGDMAAGRTVCERLARWLIGRPAGPPSWLAAPSKGGPAAPPRVGVIDTDGPGERDPINVA